MDPLSFFYNILFQIVLALPIKCSIAVHYEKTRILTKICIFNLNKTLFAAFESEKNFRQKNKTKQNRKFST